MPSLTCQAMRQLEHEAFAKGTTPEQLMDLAGIGIAQAILRATLILVKLLPVLVKATTVVMHSSY